MKTAVDWLVDHLYLVIPNEEKNFLEGLRIEALKKEKEQIIQAFKTGYNVTEYDADEYFDLIYNKNK